MEPPKPAEPEEDELRHLLEEREVQQAVGWQHLSRISTKIIGLALVAGVVAFLSIGSNRDWVAAMFQSAPPATASESAPAKPATVPAIFAGAVENPDEEALKRAAGMPTKADERAKAMDGKIVDKEDIKFAMDLMQFMQGPPAAAKKDGDGERNSGP
jgi:hypothetical protein